MLATTSFLAGAFLGSSFVAHRYATSQLFQPQPASYQDDSEIIWISLSNNQKIAARWYPHPHPKASILFSHGNKTDIGYSDKLMRDFQSHGYSIMIYDYPGYGLSDGRPSEQGAIEAIMATYHYLLTNLAVQKQQIVAYGRSLGGGPTAALASQVSLAGIILEGTFTSVYRVKFPYPFLLFDQFHTLKRIKKIESPVLIIHGVEDETIPFRHAVALYEAASHPKEHLWFNNTGHTNVIERNQEAYWQGLESFIEKQVNQT